MAKVKEESPGYYSFFCPGCGHLHGYQTKDPGGYNWSFNGNLDNPTFTPSLLNRWGKEADPNWQEPEDPSPQHQWSGRCHLFVTNGVIDYCGDCTHSLAGQKVPMKDI